MRINVEQVTLWINNLLSNSPVEEDVELVMTLRVMLETMGEVVPPLYVLLIGSEDYTAMEDMVGMGVNAVPKIRRTTVWVN